MASQTLGTSADTGAGTGTAPGTAPGTALGTVVRPRQGRRANIALWALQVLTAALMLNGAVIKYAGTEQAVESFAKFGLGGWFLYFIATAELVGGIALLVPRLAGAAASAFVLMMIGAVVSELTVLKSGMVAAPLGALTIVAIIAWGRRLSTVQLVRLPRDVRTVRTEDAA